MAGSLLCHYDHGVLLWCVEVWAETIKAIILSAHPDQSFFTRDSFFLSQCKNTVFKRCYFRVRGFAYFLRKCSKHVVCIQLNARHVLHCDLKKWSYSHVVYYDVIVKLSACEVCNLCKPWSKRVTDTSENCIRSWKIVHQSEVSQAYEGKSFSFWPLSPLSLQNLWENNKTKWQKNVRKTTWENIRIFHN